MHLYLFSKSYNYIDSNTQKVMRLDDEDDLFNLSLYPAPSPYSKQHQILSKIYQEPFIEDQPFEYFQQRIQIKRNLIFFSNKFKYPYSRAHNYHFNLDTFSRIPNQPTYAIDQSNSLLSTFPQEDKVYKGVRLDQIINRVAFTLPLRKTQDSYFKDRKVGRTHNQAHQALFLNQDEKYDVDRQLLTFKQLLKRLDKMSISQLQKYQLVSKNTSLLFLLSPDLPLESKKQRLSKLIANLATYKKTKVQSWEADDPVYFYSSIQQKLHDYIEHERRIMQNKEPTLILHYEYKHKQMINKLKSFEEDFNYSIRKIMSFYKTNIPAISTLKIAQMQAYSSLLAQKVQLPLLILTFVKESLRNKVNTFILSYSRNYFLQNQDYVSMLLSRLFRTQCQQQQLPSLSSSEAKKITIKIMANLKEYLKEYNQENQYCLLDQYIKLQQLAGSVQQRNNNDKIPLFQFGDYKLSIAEQEAKSLLYYNRICKIFSLLQPLLSQNRQMIQVLCSPYFQCFHHGLIGYISRKIIVKLKHYTELFIANAEASLIANSKSNQKFEFEFNQQNVIGVIWPRKQIKKQDKGKDLTFFFKLAKCKQSKQSSQYQVEISHENIEEQRQAQRLEAYPFKKRIKEDYNPQL